MRTSQPTSQNSIKTRVKNIGRVVMLCTIVGITAISTAPAQARDNSGTIQFGFSINSGNGSLSFGNGGFNGRQFGEQQRPRRNHCMSERQVKKVVRYHGFRKIQVQESRGRLSKVVAKRDGRKYVMRVNRCTAEISNLHRVRKNRR